MSLRMHLQDHRLLLLRSLHNASLLVWWWSIDSKSCKRPKRQRMRHSPGPNLRPLWTGWHLPFLLHPVERRSASPMFLMWWACSPAKRKFPQLQILVLLSISHPFQRGNRKLTATRWCGSHYRRQRTNHHHQVLQQNCHGRWLPSN